MSMCGSPWAGRTKLAEELAELSVELAKLEAYPTGEHPDGKGPCIRRVLREMADVVAAIRWFTTRHGLEIDFDLVAAKCELYDHWDIQQ